MQRLFFIIIFLVSTLAFAHPNKDSSILDGLKGYKLRIKRDLNFPVSTITFQDGHQVVNGAESSRMPFCVLNLASYSPYDRKIANGAEYEIKHVGDYSDWWDSQDMVFMGIFKIIFEGDTELSNITCTKFEGPQPLVISLGELKKVFGTSIEIVSSEPVLIH